MLAFDYMIRLYNKKKISQSSTRSSRVSNRLKRLSSRVSNRMRRLSSSRVTKLMKRKN
jgi:Mn-dependent DtxR family transcriptional regulator